MNTRGIVSLPFIAVAVLASSAPVLAQGAGGGKSAPLTDAHIAAIVVGANTIDIEYGKLAEKRAQNAEVRQFAALMISTHTGVNAQAGALAARLHLTPEENETSRQLAASAAAKRAELGGRSGAGRARPGADPEREERGAEIADREGAPGDRRAPGACEAAPGRAGEAVAWAAPPGSGGAMPQPWSFDSRKSRSTRAPLCSVSRAL
jgi:putative membrane protein